MTAPSTGAVGDARKRIEDLIERSSFGTPEAKALRASVTDEQAARVVQRARELDAGHAGTDPLAKPCLWAGCERDCVPGTVRCAFHTPTDLSADAGWTCPDCDGEFPADHPAVRALIAEAVQAERGRIAAAIEWEAGGREAQALHARDEDVEFFGSKQRLTAEVKALRDAARIARDGGR